MTHPHSPTRRALLGAGIGTLAISMVLSIAPVLAKNPDGGNSGSGTVKIHDVTSGTDFDDTSNNPHVCTFTIYFQYDAATSGTWSIANVPPTDNATSLSGTFDTNDGPDETDPITLPAGHYRLEYVAGSANAKSKTFWVDDSCGSSGQEGGAGGTGGTGGPGDPAGSPDPGSSDQGSDQQGSNDQGSDQQGSDQGSNDQGSDQGSNDQGSDQHGSDQGSSDQGSDQQGSDQQGSNDQGSDQQGSDQASNDQGSDQQGSNDQGSDQQGSDQQGSNNETGGVAGVSSGPAGATSLPDTAFDPHTLTPFLTAVGLLMILGAHSFRRRTPFANRA